jgi:hypothetical protein
MSPPTWDISAHRQRDLKYFWTGIREVRESASVSEKGRYLAPSAAAAPTEARLANFVVQHYREVEVSSESFRSEVLAGLAGPGTSNFIFCVFSPKIACQAPKPLNPLHNSNIHLAYEFHPTSYNGI